MELVNEKRATEDNTVQCRGGHAVEQGKTINSKGWCNLCLADMRRGKMSGTTAKARGLMVAAALMLTATAALAANPDVCKEARHLEHMCVLGTAICQIKANPAECSQAAYDCYTAEALQDQCDSQPKDSSGKK